MNRFLPSRQARLFGCLVAAFVMAGCGAQSTSGGSQGKGDQAAAKALVAEASRPVKFTSPGAAINIAPLAGKQVWIISADLSIPFHQNIAAGFSAAAKAAGLQPIASDGKGQTSVQSRDIQQAIAAQAAGIVLLSIDPKYVLAAVNAAKAAKIPVSSVLNVDANATPLPGTSGEATIDYVKSGELMAAYAIANTNGPVHALYFTVPEFSVLHYEEQGVKEAFQKYCSSECTLKTFGSEIATFKTQSQTQTQSGLVAAPTTNWVLSAFDAVAEFQIPVVKSAGYGSKVRIISINAVSANLQFVLDRNVQVADIGNSNAWLGWAALDRLMRVMLGAPPATSAVPIRLFDQQNLLGVDVTNEEALFSGADFKGGYQALWKK